MVVESSSLLPLFAELCETISHRGRSSLTVVSGALGDLASGYSLDAAELQDAQAGAAELGETLDILKALARTLASEADDPATQIQQALQAVRA